MYQAYMDCCKRKKGTPGAKFFELHALHNIQQLVDAINNEQYELKPSWCFVIDYPTKREVFCAAFSDRVVQHFVYNELNPVFEKLLIRDTASCRKDKGTDYAIKRCARFLRRATNNYQEDAYFAKLDLSGFFMAIDRQLLCQKVLDVIENHYDGKHKEVLRYLVRIIILTDITKNARRICPEEKWNELPKRKTLFGNSYGIAIGNITSQIFANYYMNDIDHFIKSRHREYVRYVDDIVIIDQDKERLLETIRMIKERLPEIHESLNNRKTQIQNVMYGIPFLGVVIRPHYVFLGSKRINRMYHTSSAIKNSEDMRRSAASRKGSFSRYKGYKVSRKWEKSWPKEIQSDLYYGRDYDLIFQKKEERLCTKSSSTMPLLQR